MEEYIIRDIRQAMGLEPDDKSQDELILVLQPESQFRLYCEWNGILGGWSERLSEVVLELFKEDA